MINLSLFLMFLVAVLLSFYFSGTEAGFLGISKEKIYGDIKNKVRGAEFMQPFVENISLFLSLVLLGNMFANVSATFLANRIWQNTFEDQYLTLFLVISTGFFLLAGEIFPKILFRRYTPVLLYRTNYFLRFCKMLFTPFIFIMNQLGKIFEEGFFGERKEVTKKNGTDFSITDFKEIVSDSEEEGIFSETDITFIKNLSSFSRTKAEEVMEPLVNLFMLQEHQDLSGVMNIIEKQKMRYIPVYRSRIDNLTGFIDMLAVFRSRKRRKLVKDFMYEAVYVPETATVENLYRKFPIFRDKLLIVVNEYGGSSGVITLDTIANKALGLERRYHEKEHEQVGFKKLKDQVYVMEGLFDIDKFNEMFQTNIEKKGFETLGGFLLYLYGEVPEDGVVLYFENIRFTILEVTASRIESIRVVLFSP